MIRRVGGLNYSELRQLLVEYGWSETSTPKGRTYHHPSGARLPLPAVKDDESVISYHLGAVRAAFSDDGILPYEAFDMRILPYLVRKTSAATPA